MQVFEKIKAILQEKTQPEVLIQVLVSAQPESFVLSGLAALLRTAQLENPRIVGQVIVADTNEHSESLRARLDAERSHLVDTMVRYRNGQREVLCWLEEHVSGQLISPWKAGGVYVITGGLGGLGRIFAEEIVSR
ncbi:hypothetical protein ACN28S_30155 [Cystobacter fuscus]